MNNNKSMLSRVATTVAALITVVTFALVVANIWYGTQDESPFEISGSTCTYTDEGFICQFDAGVLDEYGQMPAGFKYALKVLSERRDDNISSFEVTTERCYLECSITDTSFSISGNENGREINAWGYFI